MKKFRTQYHPVSVRKSFKSSASLTDQQFKADTTLEGIVRRYGILPEPKVAPLHCDVSEYGDFAECMARVQSGIEEFANLPAAVRERFGNDPKAFFAFVQSPDNLPELVKLGLAVERKVEPTEKDLLSQIVANTSVTREGKEG